MSPSYRDGPEYTLAVGSASTAAGLRIIAWAAIVSFVVGNVISILEPLLLQLTLSRLFYSARLYGLILGRAPLFGVLSLASLATLFGVSKLLSVPRQVKTGPIVSLALVILGLLAIYKPALFVASYPRANGSTMINSHRIIAVAEILAVVIHIVGYVQWLRAARLIAASAGAPRSAIALHRASVFVLLEIVCRRHPAPIDWDRVDPSISSIRGLAIQTYSQSTMTIPMIVSLVVSGGFTYFVVKGSFGTADALIRRTVPVAGHGGYADEVTIRS